MGLLDRMRKREGTDDGSEFGSPTEPPLDREARRAQLDELDEALRGLARAMAADPNRMANPGWATRVSDLRSVATDVAQLTASEFSWTEILDKVSEVPLLYRGEPPADYSAYAAPHDRLAAAAEALRSPLASESTAD